MIVLKEAMTEKPHANAHRIKLIIYIIKRAIWSYHNIGEEQIVVGWLVIC